MSQTRQQRRATERFEQKSKISSEQAQARAKLHAEWKEAWHSRFKIKRAPWQGFLFFLTAVVHILGWQYYALKRAFERRTYK